MDLTICYITSRKDHYFDDWFVPSLLSQMKAEDTCEIALVDLMCGNLSQGWVHPGKIHTIHTPPKPTVWQGKHRITSKDWWAASNARNTGICLCKTEWIAFCDDRCALTPTWLSAVKRAMEHNYAVAGSYEKVHNLVVENGLVKSYEDKKDGKDVRLSQVKGPTRCHGHWWFGCTNALPLEWALQQNGYEELCDGLSAEDTLFGVMLENNHRPIYYDPAMKIIEDRTPGIADQQMRRTDKGVSPKDKSHAARYRFEKNLVCEHEPNLRQIRRDVLSGKPFPVPAGPTKDWYDGQLISEME